MTSANDSCAVIAEQLLYYFGQIANSRGICFLDEQISRVGVLKRKHNKINSLVQVHQKASHLRVSNSNLTTRADLVNEQRNDAATATHHVAVAGAAQRCATLSGNSGIGIDDVLHHVLRYAHDINRVSGLIICTQHLALHL